MNYKSYSNAYKHKVVEECLNGTKAGELCNKYEINPSQLYHWRTQWRKYKDFPDGRGKAQGQKNKKLKQGELTDKEYIMQLEMEVDILKYMAFLKKKNPK